MLSVLFSIVTSLFYSWFVYYRENKYKLNLKLYIGIAVIEIVSIILGIIFFGAIEVKIHIIWTSFIILPLVVMSYMIFIGIWISNDYRIYEKVDQNQLQ